MPRIPVKARAKGHCHGGAGSLRASRADIHLGRYVAGYIQIKRERMTTPQTTAAETASSETEYELDSAIRARACSPVTRNTKPSIK